MVSESNGIEKHVQKMFKEGGAVSPLNGGT